MWRRASTAGANWGCSETRSRSCARLIPRARRQASSIACAQRRPAAPAQGEERAASLTHDATDGARRRDLAKAAPSPAPAAPAEPEAERQVSTAQPARDAAKKGADEAVSRPPARPATPADVSGQL